jgi:hypothetical protein
MRNMTYTPYVNETTVQAGFQCNGASTPTIFYSKGPYGAAAAPLHPIIASIARTGVGTFTITFADAWPMLVNAWSTVNGALTSTSQITSVSNVGTATPVVAGLTTMTSAAAADIAAGANNIVWFGFVFLNTWSQ